MKAPFELRTSFKNLLNVENVPAENIKESAPCGSPPLCMLATEDFRIKGTPLCVDYRG